MATGQTISDRLLAANNSLAGSGLAKAIWKATTEEVIPQKHLDYLVHCTNEPNVSNLQLVNLLIERSQNQNWVVVFKTLVTTHHLMCYGNKRFTQYLASSNTTFQLSSFLDKANPQGYEVSPFIQRYAKYLNEKALSYRTIAFDFCKVKRGKEDGTLRTMGTDPLLRTFPVLQTQMDALLEFDSSPDDIHRNSIIRVAFSLLFRDLIRLFATYNDAVINLLEKYFTMNKKNTTEAFEFYKKFLTRMDKVAEFLKVAEAVGIDKNEIPDLTKAPNSLLEAMEQHLASIAGKKLGSSSKQNSVDVSSFSNTSSAFIASDEKQKILAEEEAALNQFKEQKISTNPFLDEAPPAPVQTPQNQQISDLFSAPPPPASSNTSSSETSFPPNDWDVPSDPFPNSTTNMLPTPALPTHSFSGRPAGMSDDDNSDDDWNFKRTSNCNRKRSLSPAPSSQHAGVLRNSAVGCVLNAKQRRTAKYMEACRFEKSLPPVTDPKQNRDSIDFFRNAKQTNLGLRHEIESRYGSSYSHCSIVQNWAPHPDMVTASEAENFPLNKAFKSPTWEFQSWPVYYVNDNDSFQEMHEQLRATKVLALDLECHQHHSFLGMTALIQLATPSAVFLVDPFTTFTNIQNYLKPLLQDGSILKILHGMANDYTNLQKDFGIYALGLVDLQMAYQTYRTDGGEDLLSLENLARKLLPETPSVPNKTLADWRRRPLTQDMVMYAANDVTLLHKLWFHLRSKCEIHQLTRAFQLTKRMMMKSFSKKSYPSALAELKGLKIDATERQFSLTTYEFLHQWRERYAAIWDEEPAAISATKILVKLASLSSPVTELQLRQIGIPHTVLVTQIPTLLQILNNDAEDLFCRIRSCKCHNCFLPGHIAAQCPFPPNPNRVKQYAEVNREYKAAQNRRRHLNKVKKRRTTL